MQLLGLIVLGLAALVLEATLLPVFKLAGIKPDLQIIFLSIYALLRGKSQGAGLGFIYGLLEDVYLGKYIGLNAVSKMIVGYFTGFSKNRLNEKNWLVPGLLAFGATIGQGLLVLLLGRIIGFNYPWRAGLLTIILPMSLYNGGLAVLVYGFYQGGITWVNRRKKVGSQS